MHISQFSQETQDFIHKLCANAIKRAIKNGTYKEGLAEDEEGTEKAESIKNCCTLHDGR